MVTTNVHCYVVEVPAATGIERIDRQVRSRELLPWADPYIHGLVQRLTSEILEEHAARAEAVPPAPSGELEFEIPGADPWSRWD